MSLLTDALALQHVPRWSVVRRLREQSVAEHSFAVAMITQRLLEIASQRLDPAPRPLIVLWASLIHDVDESVTGDISSPAKHQMGSLPVFVDPPSPYGLATREELDVVKLADLIEAHTWLAMNGYGRHMHKVLEFSIYPRLRAHVAERCLNWINLQTVNYLMEEITSEQDRLRV